MIYLNRSDIEYLLKIVIFIALAVVAIKFFIYIFPLIIIALILTLLYDSYKKKKKNNNTTTSEKKKINKNKIIDAEIIKERKNS